MFHTIIIVGNVGKDPLKGNTPSGQTYTAFSVATHRQYTTGNGEQVKETIWFRVPHGDGPSMEGMEIPAVEEPIN